MIMQVNAMRVIAMQKVMKTFEQVKKVILPSTN